MERIVDLARAGATVLLVGELPSDVPGLALLAERRAQLNSVLLELGSLAANGSGVSQIALEVGSALAAATARSRHCSMRREFTAKRWWTPESK